jgi:hypothetical protein
MNTTKEILGVILGIVIGIYITLLGVGFWFHFDNPNWGAMFLGIFLTIPIIAFTILEL